MNRFDYERAVLGPDGPPNWRTRLVLTTVAMHIRRRGAQRWPDIDVLAAETSLSRRTVQKHVSTAIALGWLEKQTERPFDGVAIPAGATRKAER